MVLWSQRHRVYRLAFLGLVVSIIMYVIAFSLPYWSLLRLRELGYPDQTIGLWQACLNGVNTCISNVYSTNPAWINASRGLCTIALLLFLLALVSGCYRNLTRAGQLTAQSRGRHVECLAVVATTLGSVGCIIYAAKFHEVYVVQHSVGSLFWGFGLLCAALTITAACSCLMFIYNRGQFVPPRGTVTRTLRGPNGQPVAVQLPSEESFHIPYFGEVSASQLVYGATPLQPPSYEAVTGSGQVPAYEVFSETNAPIRGGEGYSAPPEDVSDAPPLYDEITKDLSSLPPEIVAHLQLTRKEDDQDSSPSTGNPPPLPSQPSSIASSSSSSSATTPASAPPPQSSSESQESDE